MIFVDCNANKTLQSWFEFFIPMDHYKSASSKKIKKCLGKNHWTITCMRSQETFNMFWWFISMINLSKLLVFLIIIICFHWPLAKEDYWTQKWCYSIASNFCYHKSIEFLLSRNIHSTRRLQSTTNYFFFLIEVFAYFIISDYTPQFTNRFPLVIFTLLIRIIINLIDFIVLKLKRLFLVNLVTLPLINEAGLILWGEIDNNHCRTSNSSNK